MYRRASWLLCLNLIADTHRASEPPPLCSGTRGGRAEQMWHQPRDVACQGEIGSDVKGKACTDESLMSH